MSQGAFEWEEPHLDPTLSVSELNATIGAVVRRAFVDEVWVRGEIKGFKTSPAGHVYFSLVERTDDGEQAIQVTLFRRARQVVVDYLARHRMRLADGMEVRICGQVEFYAARGQVNLRMTGIDPTYTLGRMAADRDALVVRLRETGMLERNSRRALSLVPLRVGLVTSVGSAAYHDFIHELELSPFGWRVTLCDSRVQGFEAPLTLRAAISTLAGRDVDVICVVRGGGSRTDLAAFDHELVALAIAQCPVPVLVGVGHETDSSVADLVAHTSVKTPTACAQVLIGRVGAFDQRLTTTQEQLVALAAARLSRTEQLLEGVRARVARESGTAVRHAEARVASSGHRLAGVGQRRVERAAASVAAVVDRLRRSAPRALIDADRVVDGVEPRVAAADPRRLLARGWSITHTDEGRLVRAPHDAPSGARLVTTLGAGFVTSVVEEP